MSQKNQHIEDLLDAYVDGELSRKQRRLVGKHLRQCESCRERLQEFHDLSTQLQALPIQSCPEHVVEWVMSYTSRAARPQGIRDKVSALRNPAVAWRLSVGFAAAVTVAAMLVFWPREHHVPPPADQYSEEEVAQAKLNIERALGYVGGVLQLTQETIEQQVVPEPVVKPLKKGLSAVFGSLNKKGG